MVLEVQFTEASLEPAMLEKLQYMEKRYSRELDRLPEQEALRDAGRCAPEVVPL